MARTPPLGPEIEMAIAAQLGGFLAGSGIELRAEDEAELAETLQVWILPINALLLVEPLEAAAPSGRWHHQVQRRGRAELFAYSRASGPSASDWQVTAAFESPTAAAIDRAIDVVDEAFPGEQEARLLVMPGHAIQALWVVQPGDHRIVPAAVPEEYQRTIAVYEIFEATDFWSRLRSLRHVQGLIL
jgi:hypothetical protein